MQNLILEHYIIVALWLALGDAVLTITRLRTNPEKTMGAGSRALFIITIVLAAPAIWVFVVVAVIATRVKRFIKAVDKTR